MSLTDKEKEYLFLAAELGAQIPGLDLHGFYPDEALEKLEIFLYDNLMKKEKTARIIYGGGTGKLREAVLSRLAGHKAVGDYKEENGSCVLILA